MWARLAEGKIDGIEETWPLGERGKSWSKRDKKLKGNHQQITHTKRWEEK